MIPTHKTLSTLALTAILCLSFIHSAMAIASLKVNIVNQKLTLEAEEVSIREIFEVIDQRSNIRIHFNSSQDEIISANLKNIPLNLGLMQLVRNYSHAFIYEQGETESEDRVKALFVYTKTGNTNTAIVWQPEKKALQSAPPNFSTSADPIHPKTPMAENPMISMQAIDPLMRFEAPFEGRHGINSFSGTLHEINLKAKMTEKIKTPF